MFLKFFYLFPGVLQGSHICLCIGCSTAWDEKLLAFSHLPPLFKFFSFLRRGLPCFGVPWLPSPAGPARLTRWPVGDGGRCLGMASLKVGARCPLAPPVTTLLSLASLLPFSALFAGGLGQLCLPSTVSSRGVTQWAGAPGSCVPSEPSNWSHGSHLPFHPRRSWFFCLTRKCQVLAGPGRGSPQG